MNYDKKITVNSREKDFFVKANERGPLIFSNGETNIVSAAVNSIAYTKKGEKYIYEISGEYSARVFYYPLETMSLSFNEHLEVMFKSKLWIFLVSIGAFASAILVAALAFIAR